MNLSIIYSITATLSIMRSKFQTQWALLKICFSVWLSASVSQAVTALYICNFCVLWNSLSLLAVNLYQGLTVNVIFKVSVLSGFSRVNLCATLWTVACQSSQSTVFSRQEYQSRLPCPPPVNLPDPGIKPTSLMSPKLEAFPYNQCHHRSQYSLHQWFFFFFY